MQVDFTHIGLTASLEIHCEKRGEIFGQRFAVGPEADIHTRAVISVIFAVTLLYDLLVGVKV